MESLNTAQFSNYILLGDFNVDLAASGGPWQYRMLDLTNTYCLTQVASDVTHVAPPHSLTWYSCLTQIKWKTRSHPTTAGRTVWRYAQADWEKACERINAIDWNSLLSDDIDVSCLIGTASLCSLWRIVFQKSPFQVVRIYHGLIRI